MLTKYN